MFDLIKGFIDGLRPEPRLTVSEWAERNIKLDSKSSAEPGEYRVSRTPYVKEPMDALSVMSSVMKIIFMKGAQLGLTQMGNCFIGYVIDIAPGPMLMVMPTDETVKRNSKMKITPMIEASEALRKKIKPARAKDSGNTINQKDFPGGALVMTGANSPAGLRSMSIKYLILDEVDGYPLDAGGEGSPIELAEKRTATFSNRKILEISTPTVQGSSVIEADFLTTDQRYYFVPCPDCGCEQILIFGQLKWENRKYEETYYECEHCAFHIREHHKTRMFAHGRWVATVPENANARTVGYHLSSLYSPDGWTSWAAIAEQWDKAQGDDNKLKTFVNTVLGETWKEKTDAPEWEVLYNRAEDYKYNRPFKEVGVITAGADVQKDRIEIEIVGWMPGMRSQQLDYRVILGDTTEPEVWRELDKIVNETWEREDGAIIPLRLLSVDSGYNTSFVYDWSKKHTFSRVIPIKGSESLEAFFSPPRAVDTTKHGKKVGKQKVWHVGSSFIKSQVYGFLRLSIDIETGVVPDGYCYLPKRDAHYFKGLTSEVLQITKTPRGYLKYVWVKKYDRNEPLDCRVYARAAAAVVGIDRWNSDRWDRESQFEIKQPVVKTIGAKPKLKKPKSNFWSRD